MKCSRCHREMSGMPWAVSCALVSVVETKLDAMFILHKLGLLNKCHCFSESRREFASKKRKTWNDVFLDDISDSYIGTKKDQHL